MARAAFPGAHRARGLSRFSRATRFDPPRVGRGNALRELRRAQAGLDAAQRIARLGSWELEVATSRVHWSDEMYRLFGVSRRTSRLAHAYFRRLHPEDHDRVVAVGLACLDGAPYPLTVYRIVHPRAGVRVMEQRAEVVRRGGTAWMIGSVQDVTEREAARRAEEDAQDRLREVVTHAAEEWRATFDAVGSPLFILDRQGRVRRPNRAARDLANLPYPALVGAFVRDVAPGALWAAMAAAAEGAVSAGRTVSIQARDGAGRTWDLGASPLEEAGVDGGEVIVLARDVTAIVALQQSLRRGETLAAMGRLVARVAHEVRNPLFGISATLDAFDAEFGQEAEHRQYSAQLRSGVARLGDLMNDLLEYGRPVSAQRTVEALGPLLEQAREACAPLAATAAVTVTLDVAPGLPEVEVDPGRFLQVVQNLLANAIQHSLAGAQVELAAVGLAGGRVEVVVADSGPGFRPDDLAHVFEPFYTRRRGGTGLGLSIVQRIVSEHGGEVWASNRKRGGALVTVRLPPALPAGPA
jgi:signal transduction histidine kinase